MKLILLILLFGCQLAYSQQKDPVKTIDDFLVSYNGKDAAKLSKTLTDHVNIQVYSHRENGVGVKVFNKEKFIQSALEMKGLDVETIDYLYLSENMYSTTASIMYKREHKSGNVSCGCRVFTMVHFYNEWKIIQLTETRFIGCPNPQEINQQVTLPDYTKEQLQKKY